MSTPTQQNQPVDGLDAAVPLSGKQVFHSVYAFFYNKRVGIFLILATGVLSMIGILFPQMSTDVAADPNQRKAWLESMNERYGGWTSILDTLGVFTVFTSIVFVVTMVLLALSILACTTHRLPLLRRQAFQPHVHVKESFFERARYRESFTTAKSNDEAMAEIKAYARKRRWRIIDDEKSGGKAVYIDRNHIMPFGTAIAHLSFVIIMAGFLVSSLTGFRDSQFTLMVGDTKEVGHGTNLSVEAKSFTDSYYEDGSPKDYVTDLVLHKNGTQVARQDIRVNEPLSYDGIMFHQAFYGVAAVVTVKDEAGKTLYSGGVPLEWTSGDKLFTYGILNLDGGQEIFVAAPASGQSEALGVKPGQVRVEIYTKTEQNNAAASQTLNQGDSVAGAGVTLTYERESQYTGLLIKRDPGTWIVWFGSALLVIGTCMTMIFRHRRIWFRVSQEGEETLVQYASHDKNDPTMKALFATFKTHLTTALNGKESHD